MDEVAGSGEVKVTKFTVFIALPSASGSRASTVSALAQVPSRVYVAVAHLPSLGSRT